MPVTMTLWLFTCLPLVGVVTSQHCADIAKGRVELQCWAGRVQCDPGYVYSQDNTSVSCGARPGGHCLQHLWADQEAAGRVNLDVGFPLPRVPGAGWSVCIIAAPTRYTRISVHLSTPSGRVYVGHADIRMRDNYGPAFDDSVVVNEKDESLNYPWLREDVYHPRPYPFAVGKQFSLDIKALDHYTLAYFINGYRLANRRVSHAVSLVSKVLIDGDVEVKSVNTWCS